MKIVVLDGYTLNPGDLSWGKLEALGECTVYERTAPDDTINRIGDAEIVFTNKTLLTREIFEACPNMKYIGVLATGYNVVDVIAAKENNITVTNIPTYGTIAVAQMTFALLLEICHHVWDHNLSVKDGEWTSGKDFCFWNHPLIELSGKTMGLIGYGRIGQAVGKLAQAFGMKVLAVDKYPNLDLECETMKYVSLDDMLKQSDIISLHCPMLEDTELIMRKENIDKCRDGVIILNTSRGGLIKEDDMAEALKSGKVFAFAADVVSTEPIKMDNALLKEPNAILTPHIAWAPKESRQRLMTTAVDNLASYQAGDIINCVNI